MKLPESYINLSNIGNCSKLRLLCIVVRLTGDDVCVCRGMCGVLCVSVMCVV